MNNEIHLNEPFGQEIFQTVKQYELKNNLEIGSWDGEGSTACFVEAMKELSGSKFLGCIEIDKEKNERLCKRYHNLDFVHPIQASSISYNDLIYKNFEDVWNSPFNKISQTLYPKRLVKSWYEQDVEQLKKVENSAISQYHHMVWDSVLIDGGEFNGYSEYQLLKDKTKIFFLDDVHRAFKCYQVYDELKHSPSWKLIKENSNIRNGFAIFINTTK